MEGFDERTKKAFDFAADTTKQLITLAVGIIALTITFSKDFVRAVPEDVRIFAMLAWGAYGFSIVAGIGTLMAMTGTLEPMPGQSFAASIRGWNVRLPSMIQVLTFVVGLGLTVYFAIRAVQAPGSA
jgi:hypothetical protein